MTPTISGRMFQQQPKINQKQNMNESSNVTEPKPVTGPSCPKPRQQWSNILLVLVWMVIGSLPGFVAGLVTNHWLVHRVPSGSAPCLYLLALVGFEILCVTPLGSMLGVIIGLLFVQQSKKTK
jgi:hypothetical protein